MQQLFTYVSTHTPHGGPFAEVQMRQPSDTSDTRKTGKAQKRMDYPVTTLTLLLLLGTADFSHQFPSSVLFSFADFCYGTFHQRCWVKIRNR